MIAEAALGRVALFSLLQTATRWRPARFALVQKAVVATSYANILMSLVIRENLVLAFAYNVVAIPLAAGVLYPEFGLLLSLPTAATAMNLSSLSIVSTVLRLRLV